jgi:hypothetical protein
MKLKEQAVVEMSKKKEAQEQDSCREKEPSPAEAGVNETVEFEGEMDNFQTPLVRRSICAVLFTYLTLLTCRGVYVFLQLSSLVPLVRLTLFHFLGGG